MKLAFSSMTAAILAGAALCFASAALAAEPAAPSAAASEPVKPTACSTYTANSSSKAVGLWSLKQRDDGQDWSGPWDISFKPDGSWAQGDTSVGYWCQKDDMIFFGFSDDPHTTYRGLLGSASIQGVESWNGGGTGIFEATKK